MLRLYEAHGKRVVDMVTQSDYLAPEMRRPYGTLVSQSFDPQVFATIMRHYPHPLEAIWHPVWAHGFRAEKCPRTL